MSEAALRSKIVGLAPAAGVLGAIGVALRLRRDGTAALATVQELSAAKPQPPHFLSRLLWQCGRRKEETRDKSAHRTVLNPREDSTTEIQSRVRTDTTDVTPLKRHIPEVGRGNL